MIPLLGYENVKDHEVMPKKQNGRQNKGMNTGALWLSNVHVKDKTCEYVFPPILQAERYSINAGLC
jgi:hypothetical protein